MHPIRQSRALKGLTVVSRTAIEVIGQLDLYRYSRSSLLFLSLVRRCGLQARPYEAQVRYTLTSRYTSSTYPPADRPKEHRVDGKRLWPGAI